MINCEHYRQIADAAALNGGNYETMAKSYEHGMPIDQVLNTTGVRILPADSVWCFMAAACEYVCCSYQTLVSAGSQNNYAGLDTKSASKIGKGVRGAGRLIRIADAKEVGRIKRELHVSLIMAMKIAQAKKDGLL